MDALFQKLNFSITEYIRFMDIFDVLIVAYVIYLLIRLVRETRAEQLIKGIVILIVVTQLSQWLQLNTIYFVLRNTMQVGVVALLVVFQPELRRALEKVGRSRFGLTFSMDETTQQSADNTVEEICRAADMLARSKTGALVVLERETKIGDIIRTGIVLDSLISMELLVNIFVPNTPLHDGAVVIRDHKIKAVACFLPLSQNEYLSSELGTRHRAGIGITESSDAVVVIVSEETGRISFAQNGNLTRNLNVDTLRRMLTKALKPENAQKGKNGRRFLLRKEKNDA